MTDLRRPRIDDLIRLEACLSDGPYPATLLGPVLRAQDEGVLGWCVSPDQCHEVRPALARRIPLTEVPLLAAVCAFSEGLIGLPGLRLILGVHAAAGRPETAVLRSPVFETFSGICWCGYLTEARSSFDRAGEELAEHLHERHSLRLAA